MRYLEVVLIIITIGCLVLYGNSRRNILFWGLSLLGGLLLVLHGVVEGLRWQMSLIYLMIVLFVLSTAIQMIRNKIIRRNKIVLRLSQVFGMLFTLITLILIILLPIFQLPDYQGEYPVSTVSVQLTDPSRTEIYSAKKGDVRELMVTLWYPAANKKGVQKPYFNQLKLLGPAVTKQVGVPGFLLSYFNYINTNVTVDAPVASGEVKYPLLIFSHGMGVPTECYTSILSEIASHGYIIAAVEHPYSTVATVFPEGKVTTYKTPIESFTDEQLTELERVWLGDIEFVLRELESSENIGIDKKLLSKINYNSIGVFGHSFGGAVSYLACFQNDKIKAGINLDGSIYSLASEETQKPFLLLTTDEYAEAIKQNTQIPDYAKLKEEQRKTLEKQGVTKEQYEITAGRAKASLQVFNSILNNGGYFISLEGTKHYNFTDIPLYSPAIRMMNMAGKVDERKGLELINHYVIGFFDEKLKGLTGSFTKAPYPD
ncbi:MAG TPA: hypothetical protein VN258_13350 [Mobilitalea sp.]|nr:hypothetical protein [Mobilitalea sp.]